MVETIKESEFERLADFDNRTRLESVRAGRRSAKQLPVIDFAPLHGGRQPRRAARRRGGAAPGLRRYRVLLSREPRHRASRVRGGARLGPRVLRAAARREGEIRQEQAPGAARLDARGRHQSRGQSRQGRRRQGDLRHRPRALPGRARRRELQRRQGAMAGRAPAAGLQALHPGAHPKAHRRRAGARPRLRAEPRPERGLFRRGAPLSQLLAHLQLLSAGRPGDGAPDAVGHLAAHRLRLLHASDAGRAGRARGARTLRANGSTCRRGKAASSSTSRTCFSAGPTGATNPRSTAPRTSPRARASRCRSSSSRTARRWCAASRPASAPAIRAQYEPVLAETYVRTLLEQSSAPAAPASRSRRWKSG